MLKVGLTGGYATGKSFVAAAFERLGCHVIYADRVGHDVLLPAGKAYGPAVELFGRSILDASGFIDRKRLAAIVFSDPKLLASLNAIVHPAVFEVEEQMMSQFASEDPRGIAMVEAAILVETGRYQFFDCLIVTDCSEETQLRRGIERDGGSREATLARIARQLPAEKKKAHAHFVIDTSGTRDDTIRQVGEIFDKLKVCARTRQETEAVVL